MYYNIVVSNTYCVVSLLCYSSSCVLILVLTVVLDCPVLIVALVFSYVYLHQYRLAIVV